MLSDLRSVPRRGKAVVLALTAGFALRLYRKSARDDARSVKKSPPATDTPATNNQDTLQSRRGRTHGTD